jgi:glutathione S-transferase
LSRTFDVATSWLASSTRLWSGMYVKPQLGPRPAQPLELYEFEGCPFCRKVREVLSALDLNAVIFPCPKGGTRFRPKVTELGGKAQFPFLVDPNTSTQLYESGDIMAYLAKTYGTGQVPWSGRLGPLSTLSSAAASLLAPGSSAARASRLPEHRLELYSFENSPYCRLARTTLCQLELPYLLHNVGKKSPQREAFIARSGKMQVPWLFDPTTQQGMFESDAIQAYLLATYGA